MEEKKKPKEKPPLVIPKTTTDFQRLRLERLMKDPTKPVIIPDPPKERKVHEAPEFVRNVMGSSAGAGSGEFHVYRHLRRKEYSRQKFIDERARKEQLDENYHQKIEQNKLEAEIRTARKRQKRLKKKMAKKQKKQNPGGNKKVVKAESSSEETDDDDDEKEHSEENFKESEDNGVSTGHENDCSLDGCVLESVQSIKEEKKNIGDVAVPDKENTAPSEASECVLEYVQSVKVEHKCSDHSAETVNK